MKTTTIQRINEAVIVLRHFIELSATLLPFLEELQHKNKPSALDIQDKERIIEVYQSYSFDNITSKLLMNSDILDLINKTFTQLLEDKGLGKDDSKKLLDEFKDEHDRLKKNWDLIDSN
jgi:hypothetical protein